MKFESNFPSLEVLHDDSQTENRDNSGFGVIEVLVSMCLLSIMSMAFIPLLINSVKDTAKNTTIATATQIVNQQIEGARAVRSPSSTAPSCNDVQQYLNSTLAPVIDPRGVTLTPQWSTATCPASYPGVVKAQISVRKLNDATPVASAVTMIFVLSAV